MAERHDEQLYGVASLDKLFPIIDVVDDLTTPIATRPLSAKQGKILKDLIDSLELLKFQTVFFVKSMAYNVPSVAKIKRFLFCFQLIKR